jgi:hypothetical protein
MLVCDDGKCAEAIEGIGVVARSWGTRVELSDRMKAECKSGTLAESERVPKREERES